MPDATTSRWRISVVAVIVLLGLTHVVAVTLAALPPNRYSEHTTSLTSYLPPYFTQNWRLFAPNPISEDRTILFQGAYRDDAGEVRTTDWIDWTHVELDLVHHRIVGGRGGYVTNKLSTPLSQRFRALDPASRTVASGGNHENPTSWAALADAMEGAGGSKGTVALYLRYDRAVVRLATDVLHGRWPDRDWVAVRVSQSDQGVTPYADRHKSEKERERARPVPTVRVDGWRQPILGDEAERDAVADFDRRHQ